MLSGHTHAVNRRLDTVPTSARTWQKSAARTTDAVLAEALLPDPAQPAVM